MSNAAFYLTLYLAIGLIIAVTEHRVCRGFAVMTVGWLPIGAFLAIVIAVDAFVDFSEEEVGL